MKYLGGFRWWKSCALAHNLRVFPSNELHVALYLQHLGETKNSKAAIEEAVNSLAWAHSLSGLPSPTEALFVQVVLRDLSLDQLKRKSHSQWKCWRQSLPMQLRQLHWLIYALFIGFLWYNKVSNIRPCEVKFDADHITISIPRRKSDQLCQGDQVVIAMLKSVTCLVTMLERYMCVAKIPAESKLFLFRPNVGGQTPRHRDSSKLSHSRLTELLREKLTLLGYPAVEFSLHSLRAGGATAAADAGVPDHIFKRHGRWKSEIAKDSLEKRLSVSKGLGLWLFILSLGAVCMLTIFVCSCYSTVFRSNKVVAVLISYVNQVVHGTIGKWELVKVVSVCVWLIECMRKEMSVEQRELDGK